MPQPRAFSIPRDDAQMEITLAGITGALAVPREAMATADAIKHVWGNLPRLLSGIPERHRSDLMARMCVAVATGLFDAAINYMWNVTITELRRKVSDFGFPIASQVIGETLSAQSIKEVKDADIIKYCLELNLITEEGAFILDQCRDIRNNFSVAHPALGPVDEDEIVSFIKRCSNYALADHVNPRGVQLNALFSALRAGKFTPEQQRTWKERIEATHDAQRAALIGTLHGIYADPSEKEEARLNCLGLSKDFVDSFSDRICSDLVDRHRDYQAKGDEKRYRKSQEYFEKLGLVGLLGDTELHALVTSACKRLVSVHDSYNNFYNELPFAERLTEIVEKISIPESAKSVYVETVVMCSVGNQHGTSNDADVIYKQLIKQFSAKEVQLFLSIESQSERVRDRMKHFPRCRKKFRELVSLLDPSSVPVSMKRKYQSVLGAD